MKVKEKTKRRKLTAKINAAIAAATKNRPDRLDALLDGTDDGWEHIRQAVIKFAGQDGNWAGYPLPIKHARLVVEPRHPLQSLQGATLADREDKSEAPADFTLVNSWDDYSRDRTVYIFREADGRITKAVLPHSWVGKRAKFVLDTMAATQAWSVRAEFTALERLKSLVTRTAFRYYLLSGVFIESSKRSNAFYIFRKCRPTLAFVPTLDGENTKLLAALCLHPIGYYENTFAGSMVPTDDVIAHLLMMRGDERKFWAKCNQHDCRQIEAGL